MNLLVVSDFYYPGHSRGLEELCNQLVRHGHQVLLFAGTDNPDELSQKTDNLPFETNFFCYRNDEHTLVRLSKYTHDIANFYRNLPETNRPDVIIYNQPLTTVFMEFFFSKVPSLYVYHAPWSREWSLHRTDSQKSGLVNQANLFFQKKSRLTIEKIVLSQMDTIVTLSNFMQKQFNNHHPIVGLLKNLKKVPGGVDTDQFTPEKTIDQLQDKHSTSNDDIILFTLRRLVPRMGIDLLIESFRKVVKLRDNSDKLKLIIGGEGPLREELEKLASTYCGSQIIFTGYIDESILSKYYNLADLFVLPTRKLEGFGYVTLEALACGTPVLGTRVGGTREILSKLDSDLFLPGLDPDQWAQYLNKILDSNKLSRAYSQQCRQFVLDNYDWDIIGNQYNHLLEHRVTS